MSDIDQIADRAKCEIAHIMNNRDRPWTWSEVTAIIKAACEKAIALRFSDQNPPEVAIEGSQPALRAAQEGEKHE